MLELKGSSPQPQGTKGHLITEPSDLDKHLRELATQYLSTRFSEQGNFQFPKGLLLLPSPWQPIHRKAVIKDRRMAAPRCHLCPLGRSVCPGGHTREHPGRSAQFGSGIADSLVPRHLRMVTG